MPPTAATKRSTTAKARAESKKKIGTEQAKLVQSAAEGSSPATDTVEYKGVEYKIAESVGIWPMMQFSRAAEAGISLGDFRALAALHSLLQSCLAPDDWGRFQENMITSKENDVEALLDVATTVIEKISARPTSPPSASSNGRSAASDGSTENSSSKPGEG